MFYDCFSFKKKVFLILKLTFSIVDRSHFSIQFGLHMSAIDVVRDSLGCHNRSHDSLSRNELKNKSQKQNVNGYSSTLFHRKTTVSEWLFVCMKRSFIFPFCG